MSARVRFRLILHIKHAGVPSRAAGSSSAVTHLLPADST